MKKIILIIGGIFVIGTSAFSQDLHFSQYTENPSLVNPALTGSQYVMRASVIYKDQWRSVTVPYKTYGVSYDMKFKASSWDKVDQFKTRTFKKSFNRLSGGLAFYSDKAGDGNMGTNQANLSFATFIKTGESSSISLGLQGGVVQKTVDYSKFIFSNQYNGTTGYDQTIANGEQFGTQSFVYPDFAAGGRYGGPALASMDSGSAITCLRYVGRLQPAGFGISDCGVGLARAPDSHFPCLAGYGWLLDWPGPVC